MIKNNVMRPEPTVQRSIRKRLAHYYRTERWITPLIIFSLCLGGVWVLYPFMWMVLSSFKTGPDIVRLPVTLLPREWTLDAYLMLLDPNRPNLLFGFLNSFIVVTVTILAVLFTSSLGGYVFSRLDFPGRKILFYFILSTTMVPFITLLLPLYIVMKD